MSDTLKSITFAALLCLVCSLLLTAGNVGLRGFQQKNIQTDRQRNILKAVGLLESGRIYDHSEIETIYSQNITCMRLDENGQVLTAEDKVGTGMQVYLRVSRDGTIRSYVVPIDSRGLWGRIMGYLALENDGSTISGFTVYQHGETPGLGGEIESAWFQKQFKGKKIVDKNGNFVSIRIAKGNAADSMPGDQKVNYVDGISGATLTGKYLSGGIQEVLSVYEPISIRFRKHSMKKVPADGQRCEGER